jgi:hypothetical protein
LPIQRVNNQKSNSPERTIENIGKTAKIELSDIQ